MSGQRNRRQHSKRTRANRQHGPRSATFHCRSRCVRTDEGFHALIHLDTAKAVTVRPGQPAQVKSHELPGVTVPGRVLSVAPAAEKQYLVTVALTDTHPGLRDGLPVDVSIITSTKPDVLVVPNTAVIRSGDDFFVDVLEPNGDQRRVQFTPGLIGHDTTEVIAGLSEGQEVILSTTPLD